MERGRALLKQQSDDMLEWMTQRNNRAQSFPYTYPQLPPLFRRYCRISKFLYLARFWTGIMWMLGLLAVGVLHWLFGRSASDGTTAVCILLSILFLVLWYVIRLLQLTPRLYWHCPVCQGKFPYYKPARYRDNMVQEDCLRELKFLHIPYVQPKFCLLILPSECPYCRKKFFAQGEGVTE